MTILDLSKLLMYDFHYNQISNKKNKKNIRLTDCLFYKIKPEDAYKDLYEDKNILILPII